MDIQKMKKFYSAAHRCEKGDFCDSCPYSRKNDRINDNCYRDFMREIKSFFYQFINEEIKKNDGKKD